MHPDVPYIPCAKPSKEQTGNIIKFSQFEEGNILSETHNDAESGDESDEDSIMPPLISEEEIDVMDYGDEYVDDPISTEMLEDICKDSQYHPSVNRIE